MAHSNYSNKKEYEWTKDYPSYAQLFLNTSFLGPVEVGKVANWLLLYSPQHQCACNTKIMNCKAPSKWQSTTSSEEDMVEEQEAESSIICIWA